MNGICPKHRLHSNGTADQIKIKYFPREYVAGKQSGDSGNRELGYSIAVDPGSSIIFVNDILWASWIHIPQGDSVAGM